MKYITNLLTIAIGVFCVYWAQTHSPKKIGQVITNELSGSYTLSEPWYYVLLVIGTVIAIAGALRLFKQIKAG